MQTELDEARHRIRQLELLAEEYRLKAKRMALHAAYLEGALKNLKQQLVVGLPACPCGRAARLDP